MPISPDHGARLAYESVEVVAEAELAVLRIVARYLKAGMDSPEWARIKLAELQMLRAALTRELAGLDTALTRAVNGAVQQAYSDGQALAVADLDLAGVRPVLPAAQIAAVKAIAEDVTTRVSGLSTRVLRQAADAYQTAVADAVGTVVLGAQTRRQATQTALDRLLGQGIQGFTDSAGRQWRLESYTEMAVRTGAGRSAVAGHVDTLIASGQDLVHVIPGPRSCSICNAWAGKILSLTGAARSSIGPGGRLDVAGTLDEAREAGWGHPNCRCSTGIYLPGYTRTTTQRPDPRGYELQQQQRSLERRIRDAKRKAALSLDAPREKQAERAVRQAQAELRAHLAAHPELKRQRGRETTTRAI